MKKEARILKSLKSRPEIKTPIADDMFLPNLSGISVHPEFKKYVWDISENTNLAVTSPIVLTDDTLSLGTVDISDDTNLAVTSPVTLTDDTLSFDFSVANTWTADQTFNDNVEIKMGTAGADGSIYSDGVQIVISGDTKFLTDAELRFRDTMATLHSPSAGVLRYTVTGLGARHEWYSGAVELMRVSSRIQLGGASNYTGVDAGGDMSFMGTAGFYPRTLNQAAKPAAGTGATQLDTAEMCIWTDTDDGKCYLCYNHGGTVKTVGLT